ncbi:MAG: ParA family protein [Planctomycetota bacterium]|nr:ParA family protein [Planctomycetota bacterium]
MSEQEDSDPPSNSSQARVLTVAGLKGGLGRTTVSVNLAALLALTGRQILLVDLDPMGNATVALGHQRDNRNDRMPAFAKPESFVEHIVPAARFPGLSLWPGGAMLNEIEARLWNRPDASRDKILENSLSRARTTFDLIIVDAPASQGPLCRNGLACADDFILPVLGQGLDKNTVARTLELAIETRPPASPPFRCFCLKIGCENTFKVEDLTPECQQRIKVFDTTLIDDMTTTTEAMIQGLTLFEHRPCSRVTRSYIEVCREVQTVVFDENFDAAKSGVM